MMSSTPPAPVDTRRALRAALIGVLVMLDLALVAIVSLVWTAQRQGQVSGQETGTLTLLGISAAIGVVILLILLAATLSAGNPSASRPLATVGLTLAWLRLAGIITAPAVIAAALGMSAVIGLAESFVVALALLDALAALVVAAATRRRPPIGHA